MTGKTRWENRVWDWAYKGHATGVWFENVAVLEKGETVLVIGSGVFCFYIEAFNSKTGRNEFRFANWYAAELHEAK
jgi:hypothetical protein